MTAGECSPLTPLSCPAQAGHPVRRGPLDSSQPPRRTGSPGPGSAKATPRPTRALGTPKHQRRRQAGR
ncbi:hypothetical protein EAS61_02180 [Bradyrhizobium zhanjiangense]|uniref:Uncharacterized protein n=1 Tax=Bradyrhizobium zhanjiangense TaxID=1325107 RepID=A0A4Q0QZW8_9BRAD|nr:hypothetical protein EAS61_02180 [Bradyrhizobium zhanjiangense]